MWSVLDEVMQSNCRSEKVVMSGADFIGHVGACDRGDVEVMCVG